MTHGERVRTAKTTIFLLLVCAALSAAAVGSDARQKGGDLPPPVVMTAHEDQRRMMALLHIDTLRPGADGWNPSAPNAAVYDESKVKPYGKLPDPLVSKDGRRVTSARLWWSKRRAEIVEDFDREVYGRAPR